MMKIKQVSVFLENKIGRLNEVARILGDHSINISAFSLADTSEFGVLRMIVSNPEAALAVLKENRFSAKITEVIMIKSPNIPGTLAKILQILNSEEVFIEYMYAFSMDETNAVIIFKPSDPELCLRKLQKHRNELTTEGGIVFDQN